MAKQPEVHWTHKLFVENADLYLPFLEREKDRAQQEVEVLAQLFADLGCRVAGAFSISPAVSGGTA